MSGDTFPACSIFDIQVVRPTPEEDTRFWISNVKKEHIDGNDVFSFLYNTRRGGIELFITCDGKVLCTTTDQDVDEMYFVFGRNRNVTNEEVFRRVKRGYRRAMRRMSRRMFRDQ